MKKNIRTLTPKLRFPEFRDNLGWDTCSLIELVDPNVRWSFIGGPFGSNLKASDYTPEGVRIIQVQNIGDGEFLDEYKIYTSQAKADELLSCNAYPGEIILSKMGDPVGRACITPTSELRYLMCSDGIRLVVDENRFEKMFVFLSINFGIFRQRVESAATGSTRKRIGLDTLRQLPLEIPDRAEQHKIAECLSSLDGFITAEGRTLEALKAHKKGLMQQLFPQPGQTQPRLRFPEFRDKGEWKEQPFEALYDFRPNNTYSREQLNYEDGTVKNIHYGDIHTHFSTHFHINAEEVPFVNAEVLPKELNPEALCRPGDVIFADASEDLADVGKCIEIVNVMGEQVLSGSHTILARPRSQSLVVGFGGYLFKSRSSRAGIEKEAQGTKVMQISPKRLATIKLFFPSDKNEQQAIADCLTALDDRIAAQAAKIETLKQHKRGLMQQLFPAPEEP